MESNMEKTCSDILNTHTVDPGVFNDMDNFDLLNDSSKFGLSIRLQFPKFSKGFSSSDFEDFVNSQVGVDNVVSLGRLSFPNEWQMQVQNTDIRERLIRLGRTKINSRSCWISPLSQSEVRGFIHWLPNAINNKKLEDILKQHGEVLFIENQKQTKWSMKVDSDSRYFALYLRSGKTMDDVQHFIKVDEYPGLITIRGRSPACFHCKEVGHRKSECQKYREKLNGYCSRKPTGVKRKRPRGRRHSAKTAALADVDSGATNDDVKDASAIKEEVFPAQKSAKKQAKTNNEAKKLEKPAEAKMSEKPAEAKKSEKPAEAKKSENKVTGMSAGSVANPCQQLEDLAKSVQDIMLQTQLDFKNKIEAIQQNLTAAVEDNVVTPPAPKKNKKKRKKKKNAITEAVPDV